MPIPGCNYIGLTCRGGCNYSLPSKNTSDEIARNHDLDYDQARSTAEIRAADRRAICQFGRAMCRGHLFSVLGFTGLLAKYAIESVVGVVYPRRVESNWQRLSDCEKKLFPAYWTEIRQRTFCGTFEEYIQERK
jgi:hypothetical protein